MGGWIGGFAHPALLWGLALASVPILIMGPGVRRGFDPTPYPMTRLAPTIAALLDIDPPASAFDAPLPLLEDQP